MFKNIIWKSRNFLVPFLFIPALLLPPVLTGASLMFIMEYFILDDIYLIPFLFATTLLGLGLSAANFFSLDYLDRYITKRIWPMCRVKETLLKTTNDLKNISKKLNTVKKSLDNSNILAPDIPQKLYRIKSTLDEIYETIDLLVSACANDKKLGNSFVKPLSAKLLYNIKQLQELTKTLEAISQEEIQHIKSLQTSLVHLENSLNYTTKEKNDLNYATLPNDVKANMLKSLSEHHITLQQTLDTAKQAYNKENVLAASKMLSIIDKLNILINETIDLTSLNDKVISDYSTMLKNNSLDINNSTSLEDNLKQLDEIANLNIDNASINSPKIDLIPALMPTSEKLSDAIGEISELTKPDIPQNNQAKLTPKDISNQKVILETINKTTKNESKDVHLPKR